MTLELSILKRKTIQGLYNLDPEGHNYSSLLAKVVLSSFQDQKEKPK